MVSRACPERERSESNGSKGFTAGLSAAGGLQAQGSLYVSP